MYYYTKLRAYLEEKCMKCDVIRHVLTIRVIDTNQLSKHGKTIANVHNYMAYLYM